MARKHRKQPTAMWCLNCLQRYTTYRPDRSKCCSPACRNAVWRENKKPLSQFEEKQIEAIHQMNPKLAATLEHIEVRFGRTAFRQALKIEALQEFGRVA